MEFFVEHIKALGAEDVRITERLSSESLRVRDLWQVTEIAENLYFSRMTNLFIGLVDQHGNKR